MYTIRIIKKLNDNQYLDIENSIENDEISKHPTI